jgi:hypothetical protein
MKKRKAIPRVGWGPFDFVSVGLAAGSGRLSPDAYMAYLHARPKAKRKPKGDR